MNVEEHGAAIASLWGLLEKKHKTETDPDIKMIYVKGTIDRFDSIEQFAQAVEKSINEDIHMPIPETLKQKVQGNKGSDATVEWQKVLKLANSRAHQELPTLDISFLSERTRAALVSIGGLPKIAVTDTDKLNFLERQFTQSHSTFGAAQVKQINVINPPANRTGLLNPSANPAVAAHCWNEGDDLNPMVIAQEWEDQ